MRGGSWAGDLETESAGITRHYEGGSGFRVGTLKTVA
jgi:hypothetical protein